MTDESDEPEDPAVELGAGEPVEGVPLVQVTGRLYFGIERSEVRRREGATAIRTADGARELGDVLDAVEATYFDSRRSLEEAVRGVIGTDPVQTE
jgi:hypothetical protein